MCVCVCVCERERERERERGARGVIVIVLGYRHNDRISRSANTLGKGMNPIILLPTIGK